MTPTSHAKRYFAPLLVLALSCNPEDEPAAPAAPPAVESTATGVVNDAAKTDPPAAPGPADEPEAPPKGRAAQKLEIVDLSPGSGPPAKKGDEVVVHCSGTLLDGSVFADTHQGEPYRFRLGDGAVIQGLEDGVATLRAGGRRKLTIPSHLGYGQRGWKDSQISRYTVPPGATLVYEVELVEIRDPP